MSIKVSETTRDEIREFNIKEWHDVDIDHYGRRVEWNEQDFLFKATKNGTIWEPYQESTNRELYIFIPSS